jgi:hypothetical protein
MGLQMMRTVATAVESNLLNSPDAKKLRKEFGITIPPMIEISSDEEADEYLVNSLSSNSMAKSEDISSCVKLEIQSTSGSVSFSTSMRGVVDIKSKVRVRGGRLRHILSKLQLDNMETQLLAAEFYERCDIDDRYLSIQKFGETFGVDMQVALGVLTYIWRHPTLNEAAYNFSKRDGWSSDGVVFQNTTRDKSKTAFITLENFLEAAVYLSTRSSDAQKMELAFNIFDSEGNGYVEASQIEQLLLISTQDCSAESMTEATQNIIAQLVAE